jgi:hypothetical protein
MMIPGNIPGGVQIPTAIGLAELANPTGAASFGARYPGVIVAGATPIAPPGGVMSGGAAGGTSRAIATGGVIVAGAGTVTAAPGGAFANNAALRASGGVIVAGATPLPPASGGTPTTGNVGGAFTNQPSQLR